MNYEQKAILKNLISELMYIPEHEINESSSIFNDLEFDSLDYVELIMLSEREFDISIPDECADGAETVKDVMDLISVELNKK